MSRKKSDIPIFKRLTIRIDKETEEILNFYKKNGHDNSMVVRSAVCELFGGKNKIDNIVCNYNCKEIHKNLKINKLDLMDPARSLDEKVKLLVKKWGYDYKKAFKVKQDYEPCSFKQAKFIRDLSEKHPKESAELEDIVNGRNIDGFTAIYASLNGDAKWIIKILLSLNEK